jgi:hypothetical protein
LINTTTDLGSYMLGILWGVANKPMIQGQYQWYLYWRDKWYLEQIQQALFPKSKLVFSVAKQTWRLKPPLSHDMGFLEVMGWAPRRSGEHRFPTGQVNVRGFARAYIEMHHWVSKNSSDLIVSGADELIKGLAAAISAETGLSVNPVKHGKSTVIRLRGKSMRNLLSWLYDDGATLWNEPAKTELLSTVPFYYNVK